MREIKFRAWDGKQMVSNVGYLNNIRHVAQTLEFDFDKMEAVAKLLDTDILMQFTGLKDKNGKEIYEGDILNVNAESGNPYQGEMRWDDNLCGFGFYDFLDQKIFRLMDSAREDLEVIGNIYENPELKNNL